MGIDPQKYVDMMSTEIKNIWDVMNTSYDKFVRTTDKEHERLVQHIFEKLYDQGDIYLGSIRDYIVFLVSLFGQRVNL